MVLPRVSTNLMAGLIETVAAPPYNGQADLPVLAAACIWRSTISSPRRGAAAPAFRRARRRRHPLTDAGKRFADLDTDARKKLFAEQLLAFVPLVGLIRRVLDERPRTAPAARFREELEDYMSEDYAEETLRTIMPGGGSPSVRLRRAERDVQSGEPRRDR